MTDRLDRIEALLERVALQQAENTAEISSMRQGISGNASAIAAMQESITKGFEQTRQELRAADERSRQRLEDTTADVVTMIGSLGSQIGETRVIADSNARAIQAWGERINEVQEEAEETTSQAQVDIGTLSRMIQGLIEERREDWRQWREEWQARQTESDQRFENLLQDARADRQANSNQHQAALELIRTLFLEVQRLWQRVS